MKYIIFFIFYFLFSCNNDVKVHSLNESAIINDCFLSVVDTFAYKYHSLRPSPKDTVTNKNDSIIVGIYNRLIPLLNNKESITSALIELPNSFPEKNNYIKLFLKKVNDISEQDLPLYSITKKGKYFLKSQLSKDFIKGNSGIGSLIFSRVFVDESASIGLFTVIIQDNIKSGIEKLILIKKINNRWIKEKEIVISNW